MALRAAQLRLNPKGHEMPAIGQANEINIQMLDFSGKRASLNPVLHVRTVDEDTISGVVTGLATFLTALDAVTLGTIAKTEIQLPNYISNTKPGTAAAQNETRLSISYMDATTQDPYSFILPTADYTAFNFVGDEVIIATGASTATNNFVTAFQALFRAPNDESHSVIITGMRVIR